MTAKNNRKNTSTAISTLIGDIPAPKQLGEPYKCHCGQTVMIFEAITVGGPNKGMPMTYKQGCKCTDQKLAHSAWQNHQRLKQRHAMDIFDMNSLIPPKLRKATFENFEPKNESQVEAFKAMVDFVNLFDPQESKNILLTGEYGTGKSHLVISAGKALIEKGYTVIFVDVPQLMTKIKSTFKGDGATEAEILDVLKTVDVLILDDIGAENKTDWRTEKTFEIVNSRIGHHTLYTSNLNSDQAVLHLGERNFSKFNEDLEIYKITGKDMRFTK
jgi:DNA replication protein DnaC